MSKPTAVIHHDRRYVSADGLSPIKIKVTFKFDNPTRWVRKFYGEGFYATAAEYARLHNPNTPERRERLGQINLLLGKAQDIIKENEELSIALFESRFFGIALDTLNGSFEKRIQEMRTDDRIGSARTHRTALNSFKYFAVHPGLSAKKEDKENNEALIESCQLRFSEITPAWLAAYEKWMIKKGASINSVGIHLRSLRAVFNEAITGKVVPATLYPFRTYKIRSERKFKIPLSDTEIQALKDYSPTLADRAEARDYFLFSYYCNGMNLVDVCKLRHSDIQDEFLIYDRSKTRNTKISFKKIIIPLDHEIKEIIQRRGRSLDPDGYVFPILEKDILGKDLPALTIKSRVQNFIRQINASLKGVATDLKFKKKLTTVIARHSFANQMSNSGAGIRMIQEQLGHQTNETTEHYLGTINIDKIREARKAL